MKKLATLFLSTIFIQGAFAAAPPVTDYAFEAKVSTVFTGEKKAEVKLPTEVLQNNDSDFGQLQLLNAENYPVEFTLYDVAAKQVDKLEGLKVSSARNNVSPSNLVDDNRLTKFAFDEKEDGSNASTVLLDFGQITELHRVEIWPAESANIRGYELRGGFREDKMKTIKRQTAFQTYSDLDFPPLQFLEIKIWGNNIRLEDINLFQKEQASIYFDASPDERYRVMFGNPALDSKRYLNRVSAPLEEATTLGQLGEVTINPLFNEDIDGDGVKNEEDNCIFDANKSQKDEDEDLIGDACDNAVEAKNYSQSDVDGDGVGDIIDNCKLVSNPDQANKDKDAFGNACDTAAEDQNGTSIGGGTTSLFWLGLALAAFVGFVAFIIGSKQKK